MFRRKPAPDLIRGGRRFDKNMRPLKVSALSGRRTGVRSAGKRAELRAPALAALGDVGDQIGKAADAVEGDPGVGARLATRRLGQVGAAEAELLRLLEPRRA